MDDGACSTVEAAARFRRRYPTVEQCLRDSSSYDDAVNFYSEYIQPNHISSSFGLGLRDNSLSLRMLLSLDRTEKAEYSKEEIEIMKNPQ